MKNRSVKLLSEDEVFIVGQMIEGDKKAFKYFFDKYYEELCNFANIYLKDRTLSEEVVQDIFVYFWENKQKIRIKSSVKSYLYSASKYRSLNLLRDKKNLTHYEQLINSEEKLAFEQPAEYFTDAEEFRTVLTNAINSLPEKCRNVFLLSKQEDLSNVEIAQKLNISVKTVENQMTIALKKLRAQLLPHREKLFLLLLIDLLNF